MFCKGGPILGDKGSELVSENEVFLLHNCLQIKSAGVAHYYLRYASPNNVEEFRNHSKWHKTLMESKDIIREAIRDAIKKAKIPR